MYVFIQATLTVKEAQGQENELCGKTPQEAIALFFARKRKELEEMELKAKNNLTKDYGIYAEGEE